MAEAGTPLQTRRKVSGGRSPKCFSDEGKCENGGSIIKGEKKRNSKISSRQCVPYRRREVVEPFVALDFDVQGLKADKKRSALNWPRKKKVSLPKLPARTLTGWCAPTRKCTGTLGELVLPVGALERGCLARGYGNSCYSFQVGSRLL